MHSYKLSACLVLLLAGLAQTQAQVPTDVTPDVTEDGLVRAPSSRKVGVYRAPGVAFIKYKRVVFGHLEVKFRKSWERNARNSDYLSSDHLTEAEIEKIRGDMAHSFRLELFKELVDRGGYIVTDTPTADTLRVTASILNLAVTAPKAGEKQFEKTLIRSAGSMKLLIELHDGETGTIVGRIIEYYEAPEYLTPRLATKITNDDDFRLGFAQAALHTREALDVAVAERQP